MKGIWVLLIFLMCLSRNSSGFAVHDSLLSNLIQAIELRDVYVKQRVDRIDALRDRLGRNQNNDNFTVYYELFQENRKFIYDSAFHYGMLMIRDARAASDSARLSVARMQLGYVLVSAGSFKEAFDTLRLVNARQLPDSLCGPFYALMARGYYDLADFKNDQYYKELYTRLAHVYTDSARKTCNIDHYYELYLSRILNIKSMNHAGALRDSREIIDMYKLKYEDQAVNYYDLYQSYHMSGNRAGAIENLIRAAIADIYAATKETAAMHALAQMLYEEGDIENASILIQQAREDALFYGARQRQLEISAIEPVIAAAKLNSVDAQRRKFQWFTFLLIVLVVLVISSLYVILKQLSRLKTAELAVKNANEELKHSNQNLREANKIKEEYIGYYFNSNADFLNKVEAFKAAIEHKLSTRKFEEVRYVTDNFNIKRERDSLSYSFDKVFLNLFPDFIGRFNSLFKQEDQIILKEGQLMNTELRIFALIRMGITDSEKIAKILGYSVNTIYAYKNRVKSKSLVPNEQFEAMIMEIRTA